MSEDTGAIGSFRFGQRCLPTLPGLFPQGLYRSGDAGAGHKGLSIKRIGGLSLLFTLAFAIMQFAPPRNDALQGRPDLRQHRGLGVGDMYLGIVCFTHENRLFGEFGRFAHHVVAQPLIKFQAIGPAGVFDNIPPLGLRRQRLGLHRLGKRFLERPEVKRAFAVQGQQQAQRHAAIDFLDLLVELRRPISGIKDPGKRGEKAREAPPLRGQIRRHRPTRALRLGLGRSAGGGLNLLGLVEDKHEGALPFFVLQFFR